MFSDIMNRQSRLSIKKKKNQFVKNLNTGDIVNDVFLVKTKIPVRLYKGGHWFEFLVGDKTGEIKLKFWGGENKAEVNKISERFDRGDIILVRNGIVDVYNGEMQISVNMENGSIEKKSVDEIHVPDLVPSLSEDEIEGMKIKIREYVDSIGNDYLKSLLVKFFYDDEMMMAFSNIPSSLNHHHNYLGGNLEHTLSVAKICDAISQMNQDINRDLLMAGALLHDIGKVLEYKPSLIPEKTNEGRFAGHIVLGDRMVKEKIEELRSEGVDFPKSLEDQISHMILSHHGRYEWGSPEIPKLIEALVLHYADLMDSQVKYHIQKRDEERNNRDDEWGSIWDSDLKRRKSFYIGEV